MPQDTVLVHVDVQGGIVPPSSFEGSVSKARGLNGYTFGWSTPEEAAKRSMDVLEYIEKVAGAARDAGMRNVFVQHAHRQDLSDASGEWAEMHERTHGLKIGEILPGLEEKGGYHIEGSENIELPDFFNPELGDMVIRKQRFSAFFETNMDSVLRNMGTRNIVFTGFMVNGCVLATMLDAFQRGYRVILIRDCTTAAEHKDSAGQRIYYQVGVRFVEGWIGYTCTYEDFLDALKK
jgi:ureidoacrylate peracid hydrolase